MKSEFLRAIAELAAEKNLPKEVILQAMEAALVSAYKRDGTLGVNVVVRIDRNTGEQHVYQEKTVVEEVADPKLEIGLAEARLYKADAKAGDTVRIEVHPSQAGRIAAQTAKQVVLQRLREAEQEMVFEEFSNREGDILSGVVQRVELKQAVIDLGKTEAVLPVSEQVRSEHYRPGQRMKFYLVEVHRTTRGPQLVLSRTHKNLLKRLFELEVPEIYKGIVEIKSIAREPGQRSKVAVAARQEGVDPVGSCVGLRGIRIHNIVNELGGERIDVIQWDANLGRYVANALSPAQVVSVAIQEETNTALVIVPDRQLSLAIGKEGQNARLAAKLTGWRIDIKPESAVAGTEAAMAAAAVASSGEPAAVARLERPAAAERLIQPWEEVIEGAPVPQAEPAAAEAPELAAVAAQETPARPGIRFAEDVLGSTRAEGKKKAKKVERVAPETGDKVKKVKKVRRPREEEQLDLLDEDVET